MVTPSKGYKDNFDLKDNFNNQKTFSYFQDMKIDIGCKNSMKGKVRPDEIPWECGVCH